MTIQKFIKKRPYLTWYIKDPHKLSDESIVENVLNYGDFDDVRELIKIMKIKNVANIFRRQSKQKRNNYDVKIQNYFKFYFDKYA
ncbi:MAG: hypothetical protein ABIJ91_00870 [Candidatus Kuenenbacteria bacterium]